MTTQQARRNYTSYYLTDNVIDDGLNHEFQVMEVRFYHSDYPGARFVQIHLDQFNVPYPKSASIVYQQSKVWMCDGQTIHNEPLAAELTRIADLIIKEEERANQKHTS